MKRWWRLAPPALAIGLALLLASRGLVASDGQEGFVTATVKVSVSPLVVSLTLPGEPVAEGASFGVQAQAGNQGESRIQRVTATLHLDTSGLRLLGNETRGLGSLQAGDTRSTGWRLRAVEAGSYVLVATASGLDTSDGTWVAAVSAAPVVTAE